MVIPTDAIEFAKWLDAFGYYYEPSSDTWYHGIIENNETNISDEQIYGMFQEYIQKQRK